MPSRPCWPGALGGDLRAERQAGRGALIARDERRRRPHHGPRGRGRRRLRARHRGAQVPDRRRPAPGARGLRGLRRRDLDRPPRQPAPGGDAERRRAGLGGRDAGLVRAGDRVPAVRAHCPAVPGLHGLRRGHRGLRGLTRSQILVVGAMALSPDLLPLCATCVGIAEKRPRLAGRAFAALAIGLAVAGIAALVVTALLRVGGYPPANGSLGDGGLGVLPTVNVATLVVAAVAGVAGVLAFRTRSSVAVGVAISITTIPAAAFAGAALAVGDATGWRGALAVLGANVGLILVTGTATLAVQRLRQESARRRAATRA